MALVCAYWFWTWSAIVHCNLNKMILSKILFIVWDWRVLLRWVCRRVILYMRRSSEAVTGWTWDNVAVIWSGTTKQQTKILLRWWWVKGSLAVNIGSRVMSDANSWLNFVSIEGYITARMKGMQGLWSLYPTESSESSLRINPSLLGWCEREA